MSLSYVHSFLFAYTLLLPLARPFARPYIPLTHQCVRLSVIERRTLDI